MVGWTETVIIELTQSSLAGTRLSLAKRKEKKRKKKEKNGVFSGHYVIASSLPPERLRPNDNRWNAACSCQLY